MKITKLLSFFLEEVPFLSPSEKLFQLYNGVETFVLFIGYPRSSHSLVGAILDAHPEIIIPHEYDMIEKWKLGLSPKKLQKYVLFYELHQLSMTQAMFGIRANANNTRLTGHFRYTYNVPGLWQGGFHKRIKVSQTFVEVRWSSGIVFEAPGKVRWPNCWDQVVWCRALAWSLCCVLGKTHIASLHPSL